MNTDGAALISQTRSHGEGSLDAVDVLLFPSEEAAMDFGADLGKYLGEQQYIVILGTSDKSACRVPPELFFQ